MKETWRWFGPPDRIPLEHIKQAGATGVVSALHHLYSGEPWPLAEVLKRKAEIEAAGIVHALLTEERRRGREDQIFREIPMRSDHGHLLATDCERESFPGYSMIGRLKGLAELRGLIHGLEYTMRHP